MNLLIYFIIVVVFFILLNILSYSKLISKTDREYVKNQKYYNPGFIPIMFLLMSWAFPVTILAFFYLCFFSSSFNRYE